MNRVRQMRGASIWLVGGAVVVVSAAAATAIQLQLVVFALAVVLALIVGTRRRVLIFAACLVPAMGLVRRLTSGGAGRTDFDPLVLLPIVLTLGVLLVSWKSATLSLRRAAWFRRSAIALLIGVAVTFLVRPTFAVEPIYYAMSFAIPIYLSWAVVTGRVPNVWPSVLRAIPILAVIFGAYGVLQFLFLPEWDRAWMIASDLQSIGQPVPLAVRVFGGSESPGPYSLFIGLGIVISIGRATVATGPWPQVRWLLCSAFLVVPLLLSGVRAALVGVLVCIAVLVVIRGRGLGRLVPLILVAVASVALTRLLNAVEGSSTILTAGRYTDFSTNDGSLQARLGLLTQLSNPLTYIVGNPASAHLDNTSIDVTVFAGIVPGVAISVMFIGVVVLALRNLWNKRGELAAIGAIFIAIMSLSGNVFASPFGILIGIVFGAVVSTFYSSQNGAALQNDLESRPSASIGNPIFASSGGPQRR